MRHPVAVIGASSLVGEALLFLLQQSPWPAAAFSRSAAAHAGSPVDWRQLPVSGGLSGRDTVPGSDDKLPLWICVAPIWVLPEHFALLDAHGARRVVALSSTSRFTKSGSSDSQEQSVAERLAEAEARLQAWAEARGVEWVVLRPTLIYGLGRDKNIVEIARCIRRFGFFPVFGRADGLRQPIHAQDVAGACLAALQAVDVANRAYNISGGETLPYREMVVRVFAALGCPPRLLAVPLPAFRVAVSLLHCLPRYRHWSSAMAERMNQDLVFDHHDAQRDFAFEPRAFVLSQEDVA
nr:NAD-dependent epimerase/dehydratase family protein [Candidatus Accumulibacter aalborgensis]